MNPAQSPEQIDSRGHTPCGDCPRRRVPLRALVGSMRARLAIGFAALALVVTGTHAVLRSATPEFSAPFI